MLENARRQVIFVALVSLVAIFFLVTRKPQLGLDLKGGTQLILEVDWDRMVAEGAVSKTADQDQVMNDTVRIITERADPSGTTEAYVARRGKTGLIVELPYTDDPAVAQAIKDRITSLGKLEERMVAGDWYNKNNVKFSIPDEKRRVEEWLNKGDNRKIVAENPEKIGLFNFLPAADGGPQAGEKHLRWLPRKLKVKKLKQSQGGGLAWDMAWSTGLTELNAVAVFKPEDQSKPPVNEKQFLVELVPINWIETHFEGKDMEPSGVGVTIDSRTGGWAVSYSMRSEKVDAYAAWSEEHVQKNAAIILNGIVESAPRFISRIPGSGQITGSFTQQEAQNLANVLQTGSLQVIPTIQSEVTIGAQLGLDSLYKGLISIALGGFLVVVFMFWYYRLSGLVANVAVMLNLLLILGVMQFIRATYTLPGLAGIVLTLGMAVDANILIYERIREEVKRGKAILQAIRAGFERALVTIIDANLTTFIAGIVLYNVGVGPIRGFAVTLNVGIVTTIFTAYFVSKLIFHYLLVSQKLREVRMKEWFTHVNLNWVSQTHLAVTISTTIITLGLLNFFLIVPRDVSMGLDFTGGANIQVVLEKPMRTGELLGKLKADSAFHGLFPNPKINTAGELDAAGGAREFTIKVKLTDHLNQRLQTEELQALQKGEKYEPLYVRELKRVLASALAPEAFAKASLVDDPSNASARFATLEVRFPATVNPDDVKAVAASGNQPLRSVSVRPAEGQVANAARIVRIDFMVESTRKTEELPGLVTAALSGLKDTTGKLVRPSNPIPQAEKIFGRMVSELRNAAIGAIVLSLFLMAMYIRVRFHEYKYGIAAAVAILHDLAVSFGFVVLANQLGLVDVEIDLGMIAAFLTVVGYSINDTIVVFDRFRENLSDQKRLGDTSESFAHVLNRSINQTMSRTIWTTSTVLLVVLTQFLVNYHGGSSLEGFSFCLLVGVTSGVYSTIYVATPILIWLHNREMRQKPGTSGGTAPAVAATSHA